MKLYSTNNRNLEVDLKQAVLKSLASDKGLYMPNKIPKLEDNFIQNLKQFSLQEIAFNVCSTLFEDNIAANDLMNIINKSMTFPAPVVEVSPNISTLELFHGPSLAFKDFGARFMAQLMSYFNKGEKKEITILVATSGDTGGAVASGFFNTPGIEVIILYPSGKVSEIQELQLTTLGNNITTCEIEGTFDDCQSIVKSCFLDDDLNKQYNLSSANSINIARLIPQSFYYFEAYKQRVTNRDLVVCVPSGNFGNLTAGLLAHKMGLPINHFIAATNINKVVPEYLETGEYKPIDSISTLSNAMDVGNPSNFVRIKELYPSLDEMKSMISGAWYSDDQVKQTIKEVQEKYNYILDPHGAIGYLACADHLRKHNKEYIFLETAHPCKFLDTVESCINSQIALPSAIKSLKVKEMQKQKLPNTFEAFKEWLL